jgi:PAS domain S-box-containing protein
MYAAGSLFEAGQGAFAQRGLTSPVPLLALAIVIGLSYFLLSATLMGGVARLRRGEHLLRLADALGAFRWVGLAYAGSALVSTLLYIVYQQAGFGVFLVTLPLLAMLLLVLHFYYRQQEAQEAMRLALAEIAEREAKMQSREAETATRHGRELQLSERRFHGAFTYASIGMALLDLDGRVIQSNEALGRLLGRGSDQLEGALFAGLVHAEDAGSLASRLATAHGVDFEDFDLALRVLQAEGRHRWVRVHCSFFRGPAAHGTSKAGKPCLILQVQDIEPAPASGSPDRKQS